MKDIGRVTPLDFRELEGLDGVLGRLTEDGISLSGLLFVERYKLASYKDTGTIAVLGGCDQGWLWTVNEKRLGPFFGFPPVCRSVSVGFENKTKKKKKRNRTLLDRFLGRFLGETSQKVNISKIWCACVTCEDRIVWCQEQTKSYTKYKPSREYEAILIPI